ncbi:hypothetical protein [Chachezhania antarctica]|uniref:hypothetical protein n=1 Tax=Chachezhania antarctica TaxID=2340860 RepID=UPI0019698ED5|nr:hypothetical protein [Chachezhania antarctica]
MLLKLNRTQATKIGRLQAHVVYRFDMQNPAQANVAGTLLERKFAVKVTKAQLEAEASDREALARALIAGEANPAQVPLAVLERAAILAQEAEEAATVNAGKAAAREAKASAAAAKKEAAEKAAAEKEAAEKAAADKVATDKAATDKAAADKAAADKAKKTAGGADK